MGKQLTPRERIMRDRGITSVRPAKQRRAKLQPLVTAGIAESGKTTLMRYLENKYHVRMEEVLLSGSLSVVAKALGNEVDVSTISKWIKKYKLRYNEDNLPNCSGCRHERPSCEVGICHVLMQLELYDLVPLKREEMNDGDT